MYFCFSFICMKFIYLFVFSFFACSIFAQELGNLNASKNDTIKKSLRDKPKENPKAPITLYRVITLQRDTTYIDTSLTIHAEYKFNYLRKDNFGLLPFANDGQTYNTLDFGCQNGATSLPGFGFKAKQFNYLDANEVQYFSVATPITDLYFKTVSEQGQSVDAFITLNISPQLNFSIGYKGLRSLGKYLNSLSSFGNFTFTTSFLSKSKHYFANFHYISQDSYNQEDGGIADIANFASGNTNFSQRSRLEIFFKDASSLFKGKRYFIYHGYYFNPKANSGRLGIYHELNYESKMFEFSSPSPILRYGTAYTMSNSFDVTKFNSFYNKMGLSYTNSTFGDYRFFVENYHYANFYNRILLSNNQILVPNLVSNSINAIGGASNFKFKNLKIGVEASTSISEQKFSKLAISSTYNLSEKSLLSVAYLYTSKIPDLNYTLFQSSFLVYNWYKQFLNERKSQFIVKAKTPWFGAEFSYSQLNNYLYFSNDSVSDTLIATTPKQYTNPINYLSVKLSKDFRLGKFGLDNTVLLQQVSQNTSILNVPKWVTRNTLYYQEYLFKRALFLQTGFTFQAFSSYYANEYNPLIGEFYAQDTVKIGNFPLVDFFIDAKVRQMRIFLKAEHFNSGFTGRDYYAAPTYPYRDFIVRFGIIWTFFN